MNFGLTFEYSKEMSGVVHTNTAELFLVGQDASNMTGNPAGVCYPTTTDEVQEAVRWARKQGIPFIARGAGTGLAGGAIPADGSLVISLTKMNRIRSVDVQGRTAWVEPGVLNADLSRHTSRHGLHFAPDPSSQQSCTIGGNVANNSGGPHCLSEGVTSAHILALEVVLPSGEVCILDAENSLFDLRGAFVGSEGMFGIATAIEVRLIQNPPHISTMVVGFASVHEGAMAVSAMISNGIIPSALEMMDAPITKAVEEYVHAGFPLDAAAMLIVEIDGLEHSVVDGTREVKDIVLRSGATSFRVAQSTAERALIWKGRKTAFGAIARIQPNYYLHDTVVPRKKLAEVLSQVSLIAAEEHLQVMNVFHAGDGNLHPILMFDKRVDGVMARVHRAGAEIVRVSLEAGGVLSGEHGIGLEKRDFMRWMFTENDLMFQQKLRSAFDPEGISNPHKVLPQGSGCADMASVPPGSWV
jgi:glycolate oxidase